MRTRLAIAALAIGATTPGLACSGGQLTAASAAQKGLCPVATKQTEPLIVEWSSASRGQLEALRQKHVVAARMNGCDLEVLPHCEVPGTYGYVPITPKRERVTVHDEDELFANIPLHAVSLAAKLKTSGQLDADMTVVGRFEAARADVRPDELKGACEGATHVITGLSAGAFKFTSGTDTTAGGGVEVAHTGAGAKHATQRETLNQDGDEKACAASKQGDQAPPFGCGALIRIELLPLGHARENQPGCSEKTQWDGKQCIRVEASPSTCGPGTVFAQGACIPDSSTCPAGWRMETGRGCVNDAAAAVGKCPPGSHHEGVGCAPDAAAPGSMVRVQGATFMMGSDRAGSEAHPPHYVTVATFDLDVTEVTVGAFKACVDVGKCLPPLATSNCNWGKDGRERHPINCVNWEQAKTYCEWAKKRLPAEAEWEFAAVGQTGWRYPWGNEEPDEHRHCDMRSGTTCAVGSFPAGKGRFGALDMSDNLKEWMADAWCTYGRPNNPPECDAKRRVVRNGHPAAARHAEYPNEQDWNQGFRCAKTP
jgi:hypothetical protein